MICNESTIIQCNIYDVIITVQCGDIDDVVVFVSNEDTVFNFKLLLHVAYKSVHMGCNQIYNTFLPFGKCTK